MSVRDTALRVWVVASILVGIGFVLLSNPVATSAGVVLIIVGLLSLMPVVTDVLTSRSPREQAQ
ncbi:MAG: hypothetical protein ABEH77_11015 [Halobacteriaceae archaeon]